MHIVEVRLFNWIRYRGEHHVDLAPTAYGVVARHTRDDERSNWLGKTSFLNAVRFALFGKHTAPTEDAWISHGEREGGVGLRLSDGTTIERRRERGKATRLGVSLPDGSKAFGDDAQRVLDERIGLDDGDFTATCFFPQKQISRFVVARPAERMGIIAGWLQLEPLQRAEKRVRSKLASLLDDETKLVARAAARRESIARILGHYFDVDTVPEKGEALAELEAVVGDLAKIAEAKHKSAMLLKQEVERLVRWNADAADARRHRDLLANAEQIGDANALKAKRTTLEEAVVAARTGLDAVSGELRASTDRKRQTARLACGNFDGVCPVDGHGCPDAAAMNSARARNRELDDEAAVELAAVQARHARAKVNLDTVLTEKGRIDDALARRETMLEQATRYVDAANRIKRDGEPPADAGMSARYDEAWEVFIKADCDTREARKALDSLRAEYDAAERDEAAIAALRASIATAQQAAAILGRNGAQRRLAEDALAEIAGMANESLREAGIDLTVDVTWSREGQGLADECDACGAAFPKGRAAKECSRCGAARGPKTVERVEVVLSDTSGAAEDLAGVVIQLAAGAWLRARRDAPWSTACIDEPFGALDPANKRALASHLSALLRGRYGFEQAFVVAHDRGIMDAMPGRVVVEADESGSRPTVA